MPRGGRGRRSWLVYDVMTGGAKLDACAKALKRAGAEYGAAVTTARARRRMIEVGGASRNVEARQAASGAVNR